MKIFYGERKVMQAECSAPEFYSGEWLVCPGEDSGSWDAEGFDTEADAEAQAAYLAEMYNCAVVKVSSATPSGEWGEFLRSMVDCPEDSAPDDFPPRSL